MPFDQTFNPNIGSTFRPPADLRLPGEQHLPLLRQAHWPGAFFICGPGDLEQCLSQTACTFSLFSSLSILAQSIFPTIAVERPVLVLKALQGKSLRQEAWSSIFSGIVKQLSKSAGFLKTKIISDIPFLSRSFLMTGLGPGSIISMWVRREIKRPSSHIWIFLESLGWEEGILILNMAPLLSKKLLKREIWPQNIALFILEINQELW